MASEASSSRQLSLAWEGTSENESENYDVFISHRGPDTKTGFVGYLYRALEKCGLRAYLDCKSIPVAEDCWTSIEDAIKKTPIAVVVFSESYAESQWCLKELHVMLEPHSCKKVLPIFYNVTPWDVRNPDGGQLKDGFEKLKRKYESNLEVIEQWKANLEVASKLMGWEHSDKLKRPLEVDLVAKVVERILELANKSLPLDVCEHAVGVEEIAGKLVDSYLSKKHVCALGLWGMGGIGKSTLAKALYNQLCKRFEASCYVEDVTEKIKEGQGVVGIQKRMLKDLCSTIVDNDNESGLRRILEHRLKNKNILVVLDDVSDVHELNDMMTRKMLREGSLCIVTSRDRHVFDASNIFEPIEGELFVHAVELLNLEDSKRLFTSFAFGRDCEVGPKYEELVTKISKLCGGVPLVLKVCGALLKGELNMEVWEDVKSKLDSGAILDKDIFNRLRISYDFLEEKEKMMFLDIACAFLGRSEDTAICTWRSQGWQPHLGIRSLKMKALISVNDKGCFIMHDHLRDMGREIERVEAKHDRRRLWMPDSLSLLEEGEPWPHSLETLVITHAKSNTNLALDGMKKLRKVLFDYPINVISIPRHLRCLEIVYDGRPPLRPRSKFPEVPEENQLVVLKYLEILHTDDFWEGLGRFTRLEILDVKFQERWWSSKKCCNPVVNFDGLYMLRDISLHDCFVTIISGFSARHCNLRYLDLSCCDSLQSCPSVADLFALEELSFSGCRNLEKLPNLQLLTRLRKLDIKNSMADMSGLEKAVALEEFRAYLCRRLVALPNMHEFKNLQELELGSCDSLTMVPGLCELISLQTLGIDHEALLGEYHKLNNLVTLRLSHRGVCQFRDWVPNPAILRSVEVMPNLINLARLERVELMYCLYKDVSCLGNLISL